jgi:hypothetical protein
MNTVLRLVALTVALNLIRYLVGGPIEAVTIMEPMHRVMPMYPDVFNNDFSSADFAVSLGYNFMMWLTAGWVFHLLHPRLRGGFVIRSFASYGLMCLFFVSLAAIYMNHYTAAVKPFYIWSMVDAVIVFSVVALANGWLYPIFFRSARDREPGPRLSP